MNFAFMSRELWDALIVGVIIIGIAAASVRIYADFSRKGQNDL